jgi:hypothetical protein
MLTAPLNKRLWLNKHADLIIAKEKTLNICNGSCLVIMSSILAPKTNDSNKLAEFFRGPITSDFIHAADTEKLIDFNPQAPNEILPPMSCDCEMSW